MEKAVKATTTKFRILLALDFVEGISRVPPEIWFWSKEFA